MLCPADTDFALWCRPVLAEMLREQTSCDVNEALKGRAILLNGRGVWSALPEAGDEAWVGTVGPDHSVACIVADDVLSRTLTADVVLDEVRLGAATAGLPRRDVSSCVRLVTWPWDIVSANEDVLVEDWSHDGRGPGLHGRVCDGAYVLGKDNVFLGDGADIKPCAVIDAEDGPVWIEEGSMILPHSYVQGPAYVGPGSLVQAGGIVHAGTTLGPVCKVGGEIEASIIQGYSNKQHDGFLGHSYVSSWVNIAADCVNSDLKNTYGTVRVPINGREVDTDEQFVGMFVGDHSKSGINVSFPTGAVIGFCSSVFTSRSPKFVPSFAWIDDDRVMRYDEIRGLALAELVMARRKKTMTEAEKNVFMSVTKQALAVERQPGLDEVWDEY